MASRRSSLSLRLAAPTAFVVAALLVAGVLAVVTRAAGETSGETDATAIGDGPTAGDRPVRQDGTQATGEAEAPHRQPGPTDRAGPAEDAAGAPDRGGGGQVAPQPSASSAVPAPGTYRHRVTVTTDDGTEEHDEVREVARVSGDRTAGRVEVIARIGDREQVSLMDWSPDGATTISTRIRAGSDTGGDCTWDPPLRELGVLADGASWSTDSSCTTEVGGVPTEMVVRGTARVTGATTLTHGGTEVAVWRIEHQRVTQLTARVGDEHLEQWSEETAVALFDPARGLELRREATTTLSGARSGTTRRVTVLQT